MSRIRIARQIVALTFALIVPGVACAGDAEAAEEEEIPDGLEEIVEAGRQWWDEQAPEEVKVEYIFPTVDDARGFLAALEADLAEGSLQQLSRYERDARSALRVLRAFEGGDNLADWLEPRVDFLAAAAQAPQADVPPAPAVPAAGGKAGSGVASVVEAPGTAVFARSYWDHVVIRHAPSKRALELVPGLKAIFAEAGVPEAWVWLAEVESSFNITARSPAGACGLFQFTSDTAERFGLSTSFPDERNDAHKSARAAAAYLRFLHGRFGSWPLALAGYNAGEGRVGRAIAASGGRADFESIAARLPAETRLYVPKVLATVAAREKVDPMALPAPVSRATATEGSASSADP